MNIDFNEQLKMVEEKLTPLFIKQQQHKQIEKEIDFLLGAREIILENIRLQELKKKEENTVISPKDPASPEPEILPDPIAPLIERNGKKNKIKNFQIEGDRV